jgi:hypothetical protein
MKHSTIATLQIVDTLVEVDKRSSTGLLGSGPAWTWEKVGQGSEGLWALSWPFLGDIMRSGKSMGFEVR